MDLLNEIGAADQLISAREENKVLKAKVEELKLKVQDLTLANATLQAEVDIYRKEAALPSFSKLALGQNGMSIDTTPTNNYNNTIGDDFISSGNGIYPTDAAVSFPNMHGHANPLCCALNREDTILASGGADGFLSITAWGGALAPTPNAISDTISNSCKLRCPGPVICVSFCDVNNLLACGCMDGSIHFVEYGTFGGNVQAKLLSSKDSHVMKHTKYIKSMTWCPSRQILCTASADGHVQLNDISVTVDTGGVHNLEEDDEMNGFTKAASIQNIKSFYLSDAIESLCFLNEGQTLCLYERGTPYLSYFDLNDDFKLTKISLNGTVTGGFDDHVSFAVMQMDLSPNGKYLCLATDSSRNIILEASTGHIIRNLYGHKNDCYSQPRIAWSQNGQYIFGNTQEDCSICVWDIASSSIISRLDDKNYRGHSGQVRDIFSSKHSDTVVTASYDKTVKIWLNSMA